MHFHGFPFSNQVVKCIHIKKSRSYSHKHKMKRKIKKRKFKELSFTIFIYRVSTESTYFCTVNN